MYTNKPLFGMVNHADPDSNKCQQMTTASGDRVCKQRPFLLSAVLICYRWVATSPNVWNVFFFRLLCDPGEMFTVSNQMKRGLTQDLLARQDFRAEIKRETTTEVREDLDQPPDLRGLCGEALVWLHMLTGLVRCRGPNCCGSRCND